MTVKNQKIRQFSLNPEQYNSIFEDLDILVSTYDYDGNCLQMNKRVAKHFGGKPSDFIGKSLKELHPKASDEYISRIKLTIDTNKIYEYEDEAVFSSGNRFLLSKVIPISDKSGIVVAAQIISRDMTDKKRVGENLSYLNDSLEAAQDMAKVGYWSYDIKNQEPTWSKQMFIVLGLDEENGVPYYSDLKAYFHPEDWDLFDTAFQQCINGEPFNIISRIIHPDQSVHYVNTQGFQRKNEKGEIVELFGTSQDITRIKTIEKNLKDTEVFFKSTFEQAAVGMAHLALDGSWLRVNQKICEILEYSREELLTKTFQDLTHPDDLEADLEYVRQLIAGEISVYSMEKRYITKTDKIVWANLTASLVYNDNGSPQYFISVIEDITTRKKIEQNSRDLANILEKSLNEIYIVDAETLKFMQVNDGAMKNIGYSRDEMLEMTPVDIKPDFTVELFNDKIESLRTGAKNKIQFESVHQRKDGSRYDVEVHLQLLEFNGKPAFVAVILDITERNRTSQALTISEKRLELALEGAGLGLWDHDFRTKKVVRDSRWAEMLGYSIDEISQDLFAWKDLIHPDDLPAIKKIANDHESGLTPCYRGEHRLKTKSGNYKWILNWGKIIEWDENANPLRSVGIHLDINDRKEAELRLQRSEERLELAIEGAGLGLWDQNLKTDEIIRNEQWARMLGYSPDEIKNDKKFWVNLIHPDDLPIVEDAAQWHEKGQTPIFKVEHRMKTKSGEWKWILNWGRVIERDEDGTAIRAVGIHIDIDESKRSVDALKESEAHLRTLVETIPDMIWLKDTEGVYLACNERFERFFGAKEKEIVGKTDFDFMPKEVAESFIEKDRIAAEAGKPTLNEERITYTDDGHEEDLETIKTPLYGADGNILGVLGIARDITARKRAEDKLRQSEERFNLSMKAARDGLYDWSLENNEIYFSPGWKSMLGYKDDELKNEFSVWEQLTKDEDVKKSWSLLNNHLKGKTDRFELEFKMKHKEGHWVDILSRANAFFDEDGKPIRVVGTHVDITERKRGQAELAKEKEKYKSIFETAATLITSVDEGGIIRECNQRIKPILGYEKDEIIDQPMSKIIHPDYMDKAKINLKEILATGLSLDQEYKMVKKSGELIDVRINSAGVKTNGNSFDRTICLIDDITETIRLQDLESRAERLEMAGTIAGQVAHDFNNLLGPIMAYPEIIRDELPDGSQCDKYLNDIENAARKIADINQDLLTMGRRGHYSQSIINLNRLILNTVESYGADNKMVALETELCPEPMNIKGGEAQIHRMLTNLINNAQDAMQNIGQITIKTENYYADDTSIEYGIVPKGEYVKLTVADTGCGIDKGIIKKILDPFFSTKAADKKRGSGLGLSVVDAVIQDHNGYLDLKSQVGEGTSFYVYFPVAREMEIESNENTLKELSGSEKILVVDDDETQRDVTKRLLHKLGYSVTLAESGEEAIEIIKKSSHDIVILDMVMAPGINGEETYRRIVDITPGQKAIVVSGYTDSKNVFNVQKLGAGAFVRKPITIKSLASAVRTELDRKKEDLPNKPE